MYDWDLTCEEIGAIASATEDETLFITDETGKLFCTAEKNGSLLDLYETAPNLDANLFYVRDKDGNILGTTNFLPGFNN
jgi:hypothetical protein